MINKRAAVTAAVLFSFCLIIVSCGKNNTQDSPQPDLREIRDSVAEAYGDDFTATASGSLEELTSILSLEESDVEDFFYNIPMVSINADVFIGIKAAGGKADKIEDALNRYRDYLINDTLQYPMNTAKVSSTTVTRRGNYVFLVMLGDPGADIEDAAEAADHCRQQNKIATDKIDSFFR